MQGRQTQIQMGVVWRNYPAPRELADPLEKGHHISVGLCGCMWAFRGAIAGQPWRTGAHIAEPVQIFPPCYMAILCIGTPRGDGGCWGRDWLMFTEWVILATWLLIYSSAEVTLVNTHVEHKFLHIFCPFRYVCAVLSCSVVFDSCNTMDCSPPVSSVHGDSPGKNTGVDYHTFLHGIFLTQWSNPGLPHCRQILYHLSHQRSPGILEWVAYLFSRGSYRPRNQTRVSCIAGGFFTSWALWEPMWRKNIPW